MQPEQNCCNYIAGEWVADNNNALANINPSDLDDCIGHYAQASRSQLTTALDAAAEAQRQWSQSGLELRYEQLMSIGEELKSKADTLGRLLSREEGKPLAEGKGEVYRSGQFFTYYAAEALRQIGDKAASVREGIEIDVTREPVGTIAIVTPWNFPTATAAWKIAPALCFGNAVIWKPANHVPASAVALTEIIARHNFPTGLFNLVMGSGAEIGQALIASPGVQAVSFTGSVATGKQIAASCINNFTKIQLEMGSKNALLVMDDADLDTAVHCALQGAFSGTGQKCTASSRLIVHRTVHDEFVERLAGATKELRVGHALQENTQIGPVVSAEQLEQNLHSIELAKREGAELLCGGEQVERETKGFFMTPAICINTQNHWQVNQHELFAPIACVIRVDSYAQGLELVNDTPFGLTSGIVTKSLSRASDFKQKARTGCVMINLPTAGTDYHVPFGGRGQSSYGPREQGSYAKEFYTQVKTTYIQPGKDS